MVSSSLSLSLPSSSLSRNWEHDVFPSFHGPDVRKTFLSHVLKEFKSKAINLFIDNEIKRGKFIGPALKEAIRGSKIAIVLLSKNYASSSWCLDELVQIMKKGLDRKVITIFYRVDPTDVKKQTGYFGKVFKITCLGKDKKKIETWRKALERVATIAGYHSSNWDDEALMIEDIAADISRKLNHLTPSHDFDHLIGMGGHMQKMEQFFCLDLDEVRMIGIWGPPGIGKTTIARFLYEELSGSFQNRAFMVNIKENYPKLGLDEYNAQLQLQNQMLSQMLNQKDIVISHLGVAQGRLRNREVLLVLDDVDRSAQLDALAKNVKWFGPRSRIIITTEDLRLLKVHGINHIYKVNFPSNDEALQMFCTYAFDQKYPKDGFAVLAQEITYLVGQLPLALKVMGSHFGGLSKEEWSMEVSRLRTNLNGDIESILKFSYDALCDEDKDLFLHIACFFNKEVVKRVKEHLAERFKNVNQRLDVLVQKSLVTIGFPKEDDYGGSYEIIEMPNLLAQLGKEIVRKEYVRELGKRQFLIYYKDICEVLTDHNAVSRNVIGIDSEDALNITEKSFEGMYNLQFLRVQRKFKSRQNILSSPGSLSFISPKVRSLDWDAFPMTSLRFTNNLEFLVELRMVSSKLEKLWDGIMLLRNLKRMYLSNSINLKELPNLSTATNLQKLKLFHCTSLVELPSSIGNATNLQTLDLRLCTSLVELPSSIGNATNLQKLKLSGCTSLVKLPASIGNATYTYKLELDGCSSLVELPSSIGNLHRISSLSLKGCSKLKALPININMESLYSLDLTDCSLVTRFPEISTNIRYFYLLGTSIKEVPCSINSWSHLYDLRMTYSENLKQFPNTLYSVTELYSSDPTIPELGPWIMGFSRLKILNLKGCSSLVSLPQLPDSIRFLIAENCESLEKLDCSFCNPYISLNFINCFKLNHEARDLIIHGALPYKSAVLPGKKVSECFTYRAYGSSVTVKLNKNPLPTSTKFMACFLIGDKGEKSVLEGKQVCSSITSKKIIHCYNYFGFGYSRQTDHIYIFEFEAKEMTSTEFVFEFKYYYGIKECGVIHL